MPQVLHGVSTVSKALQQSDVCTALEQGINLIRWPKSCRRSWRRGTQTASSPLKKHVGITHLSCSLIHPHMLYPNLKRDLFQAVLYHFPRECTSGPVFHLLWCFANNCGTCAGHSAGAGLMTRARRSCRRDVSAISTLTFSQQPLCFYDVYKTSCSMLIHSAISWGDVQSLDDL